MSLLQFTNRGIFCPQGDFYIDPWLPVNNAVITHAHGDHARWGMSHYLCQDYTKPILLTRIGADISVDSVAYGSTTYKNGVAISFYPAGHVVGSAQVRLEYNGYVSVVSGDYKLQFDGLSTQFEPVKCNEFVTESTFGLPIYNWTNQEIIFQQLKDWALENVGKGKTTVLIAYSLGKAQRLLNNLSDDFTIYVHGSVARVNKAIELAGVHLKPYKIIDHGISKSEYQKGIVIVPSAMQDSRWVKNLIEPAVGICSGWMQVRGRRRWQSVDAGFALSDHADWKELLTAIKETEAEKVWVTHGYTDVFSKYLNEQGIESGVVQTQFGNEDDEADNEQQVLES